MFYKKIVLVISIFLAQVVANAHEMWIEPVNYEVKLNEKILAHEKVGQNFKGNEYSYLSSSYKSLKITLNDETLDVKSRIGDIPAIHEVAKTEGLVVLSAETTISDVKYKTWGKFETFIKNKGLDWVLKKHQERSLPVKNFTEAFSRYPKSLVKVGHGKGSDKILGMPLEWLAESNPYTTVNDTIKLRLFWLGKPFANTHVGVFNKINNELIKTELTTDDEGRVEIPKSKGGEFLINAVQMIKPSAEVVKQTDAVWESLWASITYEIKM